MSIIPLQGCPHTAAKTQHGASTRAPTLLFQRYRYTQGLFLFFKETIYQHSTVGYLQHPGAMEHIHNHWEFAIVPDLQKIAADPSVTITGFTYTAAPLGYSTIVCDVSKTFCIFIIYFVERKE